MRRLWLAVSFVILSLWSIDARADDRHTASKLSEMIEELARIEGAASSCNDVRDRIAELRGRMKALRDELHHDDGGGDNDAPPRPTAIDDRAFDKLVKQIGAESFADGKLRVVREAAAHNYFRAGQVAKLLGGITMSGDRVKALESLAPRLVDPQNAATIYGAFEFEADKKKAEQILKRLHH